MQVTRRGLLAGAALGGGLLVAWSLYPREFPTPLEGAEGEVAFDAWLKIAADGVVTVAVPQLEMGQGVTTLIPQIVAHELGADWRQIAVEPAPPSGAYPNIPLAARWAPMWNTLAPGLGDEPDDLIARRFAENTRFNVTAEGTSLEAYEMPCRQAAAAARAMLTQVAAERWGVTPEECESRGGFVLHEDKRASFGSLAQDAASLTPPDPVPLRPEAMSEVPIAGEADGETLFPRLDLPAKVDGSFLFAGDVRLPDMVYAAIRHGPAGQSSLSRYDASKASAAGATQVIAGKRWLAAIADTWWAAERSVAAMRPSFSVTGPLNTQAAMETIDRALRGEGTGYPIVTRGEGRDALDQTSLARRYDIEPLAHTPLETASATARFADGRLELWIASQAPEQAREAAAEALGIATTDVILYPMSAGGSFDRRLEADHAIEIALIAREVSQERPRPVQLIWSRWQEMLQTRALHPAGILITAKLKPGGRGSIEALRTRIAAQPAAREFGARLFDNKTAIAALETARGKPDHLVCEGAMPSYAIPNVAVDHYPADVALPAGRLRGNAHIHTAFALESFIDEVARLAGREPLSYRIELLGQDLRMVECLQRAARLAQWAGGGATTGQGLACHRIGANETGARIACVATARPGEGGIRVQKITAAVDIGRIVNLDIARQQIEGGLVFGTALALGAAHILRNGLPTRARLRDLALPTLADSPEVEVDFIASDAEPADPGEIGVAVVAPAIANAIHSATGLRLRRMPLLSEGL